LCYNNLAIYNKKQMLFNPPPDPANYQDLKQWAKAHRDWKCQKEGWTFSTFYQFIDKVQKDVEEYIQRLDSLTDEELDQLIDKLS
jgi:hypothetical protein